MIVQTDLESSEVAVLKMALEMLERDGNELTAMLFRQILKKMGVPNV